MSRSWLQIYTLFGTIWIKHLVEVMKPHRAQCASISWMLGRNWACAGIGERGETGHSNAHYNQRLVYGSWFSCWLWCCCCCFCVCALQTDKQKKLTASQSTQHANPIWTHANDYFNPSTIVGTTTATLLQQHERDNGKNGENIKHFTQHLKTSFRACPVRLLESPQNLVLIFHCCVCFVCCFLLRRMESRIRRFVPIWNCNKSGG